MPTVYLIHFDKPLKHARHYLGYTCLENVQDRLARHRRGDGSKLLRACNLQGISYDIVRTWECENAYQAKHLERMLKNWKKSSQLCPICKKERMLK